MGFWADLLRGPAPSAEGAELLLSEGRAALWSGRAKTAQELLARAARGHRRPAVPRAYLSLARRMRTDFAGALKEASEAVKLDKDCLEARAAQAAALLSSKKLVEACLAYRETTQRRPYDDDGHALRLLMVALFAETIADAREDDEGLRFDFRITPATRCVIRALDGRALLGVEEAANAPNSTVIDIAVGAAFYFSGRLDAARTSWARAAEAFPEGPSNATIRESLRALSRAPAA